MKFMNQYEIEHGAEQLKEHPVLGPATQTLLNLVGWANRNSDGWAYWPKPARAAKQLIELVETAGWYMPFDAVEITPAQYRKALAPIKAFRTRHGADFEIVEAG